MCKAVNVNILFSKVFDTVCLEKKQRMVTDQNCVSEPEIKE